VAKTNNQVTVLGATGSGAGLGEVLAGLASDLSAGLRAGDTGNALLSAQFEQLRAVSQTQTDAVSQNTQAVLQNTVAQASSGGGSTAGSIGSTVAKIFGSGLGLSPLVKGLVGLFTGGGSQPVPPPLVTYTRPPSLQFEGSITRSETAAAPLAEYTVPPVAQFEGSTVGSVTAAAPLVRYTLPPSAQSEGSITRSETGAPQSGRPAGTSGNGAQVTIQVQAMDSRSFLDHREEIAQAVRAAMLNSHSLNDVVNDL
jgi:hypothetical protein